MKYRAAPPTYTPYTSSSNTYTVSRFRTLTPREQQQRCADVLRRRLQPALDRLRAENTRQAELLSLERFMMTHDPTYRDLKLAERIAIEMNVIPDPAADVKSQRLARQIEHQRMMNKIQEERNAREESRLRKLGLL
jgi:hypothetical protein